MNLFEQVFQLFHKDSLSDDISEKTKELKKQIRRNLFLVCIRVVLMIADKLWKK